MTGEAGELTWNAFEMELWTFTINEHESILSHDFEIDSEKLPYVKALNIKPNSRIRFLPVFVANTFPNLIAYGASNCSLTEISDESFKYLYKLQFILLQNHRISIITSNAFANLKRLKYLYLGGNSIQYIEDNHFKSLKSLQVLKLTNNNLGGIEEGSFSALVELRNVSLALNRLKRLSGFHFQNNKKLENIWLQDNLLQVIDSTTFDEKPNLRLVSLKGNTCFSGSYKGSNYDLFTKILGEKC